MPCYDPPGMYGPSEAEEEAKTKLDKLTRLLCEACELLPLKALNGTTSYSRASKELVQWWKEHQEFDRKRGAK